ncbi:MAG: DHH family phosphoesterase [Patescibacteria group bacterium]
MALTQEQQALESIMRAKRILIATRQNPDTDAVSSAVGLLFFLHKLGKQAEAVVPGSDAGYPSFLPASQDVRPRVGAVRAFEITLNVEKNELGDLQYGVKDGKLVITAVPKNGEWSPADIAFRHGEDRYDLVIAIGTPDLQSLGELFREHADFLYRTTIVNVDRDAGNEHWGQLNLVDLSAVSVSEILFGWLEKWNRNLITEDIATAFLAGMIAQTQSFRTNNVTPKTLQTASQLMAMGARREEIVNGLWRTRSIPTLRLWGRTLSRLETDREFGLVWSALSRQDFLEAGAGEAALEGIVRELVAYAPEAKVIALIYEPEDFAAKGPKAVIHALPPYSAQDLARRFGASGTREKADFHLGPETTLVQAAEKVIQGLRESLRATK